MDFVVFVGLMVLAFILGAGLTEICKSLSEISESLDVLANHLEHSCDKCKATTEEESSD